MYITMPQKPVPLN